MMFDSLRNVFHPAHYHGRGKRPPFFEGWYFKLVDASNQHPYAIIPGIFLSDDPARQHAFVQVLDGDRGQGRYTRYPVEAFTAKKDAFDVVVGDSRFSGEGLALSIESEEGHVAGSVRFGELRPWPVTWRAPGVMGPYAWMPAMECYHGVLSLTHSLEGALRIDGEEIDFSGGRGYIEKDWGKSFPAAWVWMQSNNFLSEDISFTASIAIVPWLTGAFPGFVAGLLMRNRLHRFATYTGAWTEHLEITDDHVHWIVRDKVLRLQMYATRAEGGLLYGPDREAMHMRVSETLNAELHVNLSSIEEKAIFYAANTLCAGLEVQGDLESLLALQQRQT